MSTLIQSPSLFQGKLDFTIQKLQDMKTWLAGKIDPDKANKSIKVPKAQREALQIMSAADGAFVNHGEISLETIEGEIKQGLEDLMMTYRHPKGRDQAAKKENYTRELFKKILGKFGINITKNAEIEGSYFGNYTASLARLRQNLFAALSYANKKIDLFSREKDNENDIENQRRAVVKQVLNGTQGKKDFPSTIKSLAQDLQRIIANRVALKQVA